jgi:hypothetical protein
VNRLIRNFASIFDGTLAKANLIVQDDTEEGIVDVMSQNPYKEQLIRLGDSSGALSNRGQRPSRQGCIMSVRDQMMTISENLYDSEQNLRWRAWENKNRREDTIAAKRMKLVFVFAGVVILFMWVLSVVR